jgi:hypothetical protein
MRTLQLTAGVWDSASQDTTGDNKLQDISPALVTLEAD